MTYTEKDIKHLELMTSLAEQEPVEDEVFVEAKESFDEKMLKLCNGLREKGLVKHAEELEQKFITYKAAKKDGWLVCEECGKEDETKKGHSGTSKKMHCPDCCPKDEKDSHGGNGGLARRCRECCPTGHGTRFEKSAANTHLYRAHDEDGEDVINAAHPDPDPNMGDGDLGDVENILSKHKKIVDVIKKEPNGKLGSYVNACKIVLAQAAPESPEAKLYEEAKSFLEHYIEVYDTISNITEGEKTNVDYFNVLKNVLNEGNAYKHENFAASLINATEGLRNDGEPGVFSLPSTVRKWQDAQKYFSLLDKYGKRFNAVVSQLVEIEKRKYQAEEAKEAGELDPDVKATNRVNELIKKLKQYSPRLTRYEAATNYINTTVNELNNLLSTVSQQGTTPEIDNAITQKEQEVNKFAVDWKLGG